MGLDGERGSCALLQIALPRDYRTAARHAGGWLLAHVYVIFYFINHLVVLLTRERRKSSVIESALATAT